MAKKKTRSAKKAQAPLAVRRKATGGALADPRVRAWDKLLRDPCAGNLAHPCYAGVDSGYLIRTTDIVPIQCGDPATGPCSIDSIIQVVPLQYGPTSGLLGATALTGTTIPMFTTFGPGGNGNFITTATVKRFRPVAACLKWIPTGPYGQRSGLVGLAYSPGQVYNGGDTATIASALQNSIHYAPNGSEAHEIRWLPTAADENFVSPQTSHPGAGTLLLTLRGVDAIGSGGMVVANGYLEVTVVWEWIPTAQVTTAPQAPLPYTSQQVLATIEDMGAYLLRGARVAADKAFAGAVRGAASAAAYYLTGGYRVSRTQGSSMPVLL